MSIKTTCPDCGRSYTVADQMLGKTVQCKSCPHAFEIKNQSIDLVKSESLPEHYGLTNESVGSALIPPREVPFDEPFGRTEEEVGRREGGLLGFPLWFIAGGIGAGIGALIWAGIGYFLNTEISYIALGVGFLAGLGARIGSGNQGGFGPGFAAVIAGVLGVIIGKLLVFILSFQQGMEEISDVELREIIVSDIAASVVVEWEAEGKPLVWPFGKSLENAYEATDYPAGVWAEAQQRWNSSPPEEKVEIRESYRAQFAQGLPLFELIPFFFMVMTTPPEVFWNLLWIGLAGLAAYRVGATTSEG